MSDIEDDIHDKLTKAYLEYFKANEKWEVRRSVRTYYATQKWLREIQKLGKAKQKENTEIFRVVQNRLDNKK
jgi:hypothetical protein